MLPSASTHTSVPSWLEAIEMTAVASRRSTRPVAASSRSSGRSSSWRRRAISGPAQVKRTTAATGTLSIRTVVLVSRSWTSAGTASAAVLRVTGPGLALTPPRSGR